MASLGRLCASPSIASFASSHSKTCIFSSPRLFFKHPIPSSSLISSFVSSPIHAHPSDTLHNTTGVEKEEEEEEEGTEGSASNGQIDTVSAVLFDMDGVLCDSEDRSRKAAVDLFAEMGFQVSPSDFIPFMGTGEANFLGGVARTYGITDFDANSAKAQFFKIYFEKYAQPNSGLAYSGALNLIKQCKMAGLKLAVASSADRVKVDVNLAAAGLPQSCFDAIVSADAFENLKPAPDIFLAAAKILNVPPNQCIVIEDALAGLQAANAAGMRCIAVTTTLGKEKLIQGRPSLIRKDIGDISLNDIVNLQKATDFGEKKAHSSKDEIIFDGKDILDNEGKGFLSGLQMSLDSEILPGWEGITRREVLKFTSLAAGLSCIFITISRWKAMSYTSPKSIMNAFSGLMKSQFTSNSETSRSDHVMQIKHYIADLESRGGGEEVPDFSVGLDWLNTTPLQLHKDLRGKVVIFDFWTYCCINCMHVLPDLDYLEKKYKDKPFTVVGVHSAKFDNEKDLDAIRNAVLRYNVTHPVVNDGEMIMWRRLGVNSWPTFVVVSPEGRVVARLTGEGHRQDLGDIVEAALQYYGERKLLDNNPIPKLLESQKDPRLLLSPLKFPGKLVIDLANQRLFISDSNHHRIVVTDLKGNFIQQVGGRDGDGFHDGPFEDASFSRPQGLCYNYFKNVLYVADTENHALREVDFMSETVRTLAGNGEKGLDYKGGKKGMLQVLNSPWDLCFEPVSGVLYIAMAGQHQIWIHDLADGTTKAFSGDGYERNRNGKRGSDTSYAQPSGLSLSPDTKEIYVADSESSSIRATNLNSGGSRLLAGGDPVFEDNLFQFGDKDGVGIGAQFQHPLGVFCGPKDLLFIADSYNHKIKVMDLKSKQVKTLAGTGHAGYKDGNGLVAQLSEPAGLTQGPEGSLYIADTNNNVIRILSLKEGGDCVLSTLELKGVKSPLQNTNVKPRRLHRRPSTDTEIVQIEPISSISGDLQLLISLPAGYHFTKGASSKFLVDLEPEEAVTLDPLNGVLDDGGHALLHFKCLEAGSAKAQIYCKVYYCQKDEVCLYKALLFQVPFSPSSGTSTETVIKYDVKPPATINGWAKAIS